jgi:tRNA threonylcarbamoyladenosine biosynthesis protein TsaB
MPRILLIETASEVCSVAIAIDGKVVAHAEELQAQSHSALLTMQIEACSKAAGVSLASLDAVAVSSGPGAYTSLRVGASVAKGICYALGKPLIAVDTLLALAGAAREEYAQTERPGERVLFVPALDARRQEIWTALYDENLSPLIPAQPLILGNNSFEDFVLQGSIKGLNVRTVIAGNGSDKIRSGVKDENSVFFTEKKCSALHLISWAEKKNQVLDFQDVAYFEPFYMKLPNITIQNNIGI